MAKPGDEAAPDRARPRALRSCLKIDGFSFEAFCAKAQKSNQSMGFGSLLVLRFSLFLSAKRLSFACGLSTATRQQRRIPSLSAFYTHWQIERKVEKFKFRARGMS
ncbi:MAG: hypothetical protein ACOX7Q_16395 [Kiritimatiellia bacterium]